MMRVKNLRGFHHQRHIPQSFAHHRFPQRRRGQQRRQTSAFLADPTIAKEEESRASAATQRGSCDLSNCAARARDSRGGREGEIDAARFTKYFGKLRELRSIDQWR